MLDEIVAVSEKYYTELIAVHSNERLRGLTQLNYLTIIEPKYDSNNGLFYNGNGFYARVPKCVDSGSYCENAYYQQKEYNFTVENNILVAETHKGKYELLGLFPELTPNIIEQKLCAEIAKMPLYKGIKAQN